MEQKSNIFDNPNKVTEWLCSTGYLFPSNEIELFRFDKLFPKEEIQDSTVSIDRILGNNVRQFPETDIFKNESEQEIIDELKMVARNGLEGLPDHIIRKMQDNQNKDDEAPPEEED